MLDTFRKLRALLSPREQRQGLLLLAMMLVLGMVEMAGVASIFPLIAVLSDQSLVERNQWLKLAYDTLGFTSLNSFFIFLSAATFALIVIRTLLTAVSSYGLLRYAQMRSHALSSRMLRSYLKRPYTFFLNRHSADMGTTVLSEVDQVISGSLMPTLRLLSQGIIACFIIAVVIIIDPLVAAIALSGVVGAYGLVYIGVRDFLRRKGIERIVAINQRYRIAQEVLAGVKEVKVGGLEHGYLTRYESASFRFSRLQTQLDLVREVPRHVLELIAVGGILCLILLLLFRADGNFNAAIPTIAVYAFAGLRLLPAVQTFYQSVVALRFGGPALDALHADLFSGDDTADLDSVAPLSLKDKIELRNVAFTYQSMERQAVQDISLTIPKHHTVGLIGATGAGKSTLVDIILGLLEPDSGAVLVDGAPVVRSNVRSWQRSIGYVPQQIFLSDESIASNIAFGLRSDPIDMTAVERAAKMANIHDFVVDELPLAYSTKVGDRGVRLSGGQRQRIGIARALYHDPEVVVLDEATSALDNITEQAVMKSMRDLAEKKTVIMIAHRLTTVKACDQIVMLSKGKIVDVGTFDELEHRHALFQTDH